MTDMIGREVHHLALELRPTALDDLGLQAALANYTEGWAERSGVEIDFHGSGLDANRLPPPVETALYRVVQEALTNVLKHATAKRVSVVLQRSPDQVSAVVEDDGVGFDADSVPSPAGGRGRLGLLGMRERVCPWSEELLRSSPRPAGGRRLSLASHYSSARGTDGMADSRVVLGRRLKQSPAASARLRTSADTAVTIPPALP